MAAFCEDTIEQAALSWLSELGYGIAFGPEIAPGEPAAERDSFDDVVLKDRLRAAIDRLNPAMPADAREEAFRKVTILDSPTLIGANRAFHKMLRDGVAVEYRRDDGSIAGDHAQLLDRSDSDANDWLAVNQFTVIESGHNRRPDIVLFVNGLPLVVLELKNPADEDATIDKAFAQLQTYKAEIPSLFRYNELAVISDGGQARIGSFSAGIEWFKPWRTIDSEQPVKGLLELEVLIRGALDRARLLDLVSDFVLFEDDPDSEAVFKILAGYHQFHAAQKALTATIEATREDGNRRGGVVWHTQGSGKSFTMLFYAGLVVSAPEMNNPTLVVLTDRNDLDDQLFGQFQRCSEILRQKPIQADSVDHLREVLQVASGGVVFTTVHKFAEAEGAFPLLSERSNIVVVADEAHRSQYGFHARHDVKTGKTSYGFARNIRDALPNASYIGFTGTPVELDDKNTRAVFGDYISIYDIQRAVADKATVPIYYESRIIKMMLEDASVGGIDESFEEITESEELDTKEKLKTKWAALEAMVGDDDRIDLLARDLVSHFEKRQEAMAGKGMIVCMSRRICVDLYNALINLRPEWHSEDDEQGFLKVIMTGAASDPVDWQQHIRTAKRRKDLARHFKSADSPFQLVIVRDMWLTGFDAPCLHTMYLDKPMEGHGLMQAIARVNRVFREKPGGLVVDYLGIGDSLKKALKTYTESGGSGETTIDADAAVTALQKNFEQCRDMLHGFDWSKWTTGAPAERATLPLQAQEFLLEQDEGKERWVAHVGNLSKAYALCPTSQYAEQIREDVAFFQIVRTMFRKYSASGKSQTELDAAVRQLVSKAVMTADSEVIDVFSAAGIDRPDVSILSDEFLEEVRSLPYKNVAAELLKKLLKDEIKVRHKRNVVQARNLSEMLQSALNAYHNRAISTQEIIDELIRVAKEFRAAQERGEDLGLNNDEICFYDALAQSESAMDTMGCDKLKVIATELVMTVRKSVSIDWTSRETARAKIRVIVRRILNKHGYPPDLREEATKLVLEQAAVLSAEWAK
ncbi:Type-1 restriction enzyme R protein [Posidoniimonas polymericola]|uniref:Type I restriction enzyme endonuclease subunit n=1 Tax=Posidoniimonas polymericola TaxID=2528002 RepID=A0A5C5XV09_9BACT|nr:type I restriction endonuclease subunit R [Posidoniimonas polymericola]TWT66710.1 Type-1 restriction enzyme R protein [Posidoniimonas polymericola]